MIFLKNKKKFLGFAESNKFITLSPFPNRKTSETIKWI